MLPLPKILKYATSGYLNAINKRLLCTLLIAVCTQLSAQQVSAQTPTLPWHGIQRQLRYHPDGQDFVINNGMRRFNRALYGTNTAFRVEAGDLPEFAFYLPGMGGNLKFGLISGSKSKWLINAASIEARYRPGSMIYIIKDELLGKGSLTIQVLAGADAENIIVKARFSQADNQTKLFWAFGGATGKKFSRDGDIGADPESSFYLQPEYCKGNTFEFANHNFTLNFSGKSLSEAGRYEVDHEGTGKNKAEVTTKNVLYGIYPASAQVHLVDAGTQTTPAAMLQSKGDAQPVIAGVIDNKTNDDLYWVIQNGKPLTTANPAQLFNQAEAKRAALASRVKVHTPDAYINTLGGTLSIAADGIWESPSYMHGAVAWRMRLPAWRGPYVADPLGWHDRAWQHFSSYALSQITEPDAGPVVADTNLHVARQLEKLGTSMFSSGYISRNPGGKIVPHHYDMNLVYIDELLNHFKWTGNISEVKQLWPTIERSLAWEKRNFDADGDGLYDAYCAIWASDALQYSGGGVTHSSAYNYRANKAAASLAKLVGDDPKPYEHEAARILNAINHQLWMPAAGSYAEYKDLLGEKLLHPSAGLWTIYHAIDSDVPDAFQSYQALRYVDTQIPHIPVIANGLTGNNYLLSTTNWLPYDWSLNNVVMAENLHTALAYWQGGQAETAFTLWKSALLESMYLGASPGNFQQLSFYDAIRGELYRDFADPIGMTSRSLVEGLFGIRPNLLNDTLTIKPGLPAAWNYASLNVPDIKFDFKRNGQADTYTIIPSFQKSTHLNFEIPARAVNVTSVTINGMPVKWMAVADAVGQPVLRILAGKQKSYLIKIVWSGAKPDAVATTATYTSFDKLNVDPRRLKDPQHVLAYSIKGDSWAGARIGNVSGYHTYFIKYRQGQFSWWQPVNINVIRKVELIADNNQPENALQFKVKSNNKRDVGVQVDLNTKDNFQKKIRLDSAIASAQIDVPAQYLMPGSNPVRLWYDYDFATDTTIINWHITPTKNLKQEQVDLKPYFNDQLTNIFKNKYLSPRPQSPTLQLPWQGIGNWAYPLVTANIDDSGLKKAAAPNGLFTIPQQISFATPTDDVKNIIYTSQWDNYPKLVEVPLSGKATHAYFLMAGSTNPMQTRLTNALLTVTYTDGSTSVLPLKNPENWWPIEQDDDNDGFAFNTGAPKPLRVNLKTGEVSDNFKTHTSIKGFSNKAIDGGAATVLDLPLDKSKALKSLQLKTVANDVVVGLMSVTLIRE
jgi:hypothetical protein